MESLANLPWPGVAGAAGLSLIVALATHVVYNLVFHPLARFPGPFFHRATQLAYIHKFFRGTLPMDVLGLHEKFGPVVRLAPGELSFAEPEAWKDIYGRGAGSGQPEMTKYDKFYRMRGMVPSIFSEDKDRHTMLRRQLSHGFSDRIMREQEPIIGSYVDLLIRRLRERCDSAYADDDKARAISAPLDMTAWYNWTTFDIIGDLAFGEPFGCLEKAEYDPWVAAANRSVMGRTVSIIVRYLNLGAIFEPILLYVGLKSLRVHFENVRARVRRRMQLQFERPDLIEGILKKTDDKEWAFLDMARIQANAATLVVGGSETTAALLSGVTYLLLKNPEAMKKLADEVRSSFQSEDEITLTSVSKLRYMLACLDEALRRYPPAPFGMPRVVPKGGAVIAGHAVPEDTVVAVWHWATYHNSKMWKDPFEYRPERFQQDSKFRGDRLDALQPFSVGPRNCIGRNLAYAEMRLILARIIYNFDMRLVDENDDWLEQHAGQVWLKKPLNVSLTAI